MNTPPSAGPAAKPRLTIDAQNETARARARGSGYAWLSNASDAGSIIAAPNPCAIRNMTRNATLGASAQQSDIPVKSASPSW